MDLEEQIEKEQERNDGLRLEIEQSKFRAYSLYPTPSRGGSLLPLLPLARLIRELERQLKESDQRLEALMRKGRRRTTTRVPSKLNPIPPNINPDILKRRAIVRQNSDLPSRELCETFDRQNVPLPEAWREKFGVNKWSNAYLKEQCRPLIHTLISKDRRTTK